MSVSKLFGTDESASVKRIVEIDLRFANIS